MIAGDRPELPPPPTREPVAPARLLPSPQEQQASRNVPDRPRTRTIIFIVAGVALVLLTVLAIELVVRIKHDRALAAAAHQAQTAAVKVMVIHASKPKEAALSLAANTQAIQDAVIFARTSGYLSKRYVDLGDHVKAGQLMAEIESPEIDQQLRQAQADLQQSYKNLDQQEANLEFARVTVERYKAADKEGAVAKEDVDQRITAYQAAQATVAAAQASVASSQANVARYEELTKFERVTAPFDGTVVQRNVDVGSLITSGSPTNNTTAAPTNVAGGPNGLFEVAQLDTLRVFVNVPQVYAPNVKVGIGADIAVRGQLASPVSARVTRFANALDPATRTLLTEVDIPNENHRLMAGMFVYVGFRVSPSGTRWRVPDTAVIFNDRGTQVVVVGAGNKLHVQPVIVGRDFGNAVEIQSGIDGSQWIVKQPTVSLQEGQVVEPAESKDPPTG